MTRYAPRPASLGSVADNAPEYAPGEAPQATGGDPQDGPSVGSAAPSEVTPADPSPSATAPEAADPPPSGAVPDQTAPPSSAEGDPSAPSVPAIATVGIYRLGEGDASKISAFLDRLGLRAASPAQGESFAAIVTGAGDASGNFPVEIFGIDGAKHLTSAMTGDGPGQFQAS